jgi:hypothetical protein
MDMDGSPAENLVFSRCANAEIRASSENRAKFFVG